MEVTIPLKLKYRNPNHRRLRREGVDPPGGTLVFNGGKYAAKKGGNSGTSNKAKTLLPRMKKYWGNVLR